MSSFPFFKQVGFMDCGPACLQMVANYYGKDYSLSTLSSISPIGPAGTSLLDLGEAAERIGFNTFSVKTTLEKIREEDILPCITLWRERHFIVIYKVDAEKLYVADPAQGLMEFSTKEFMEHWAIAGDDDQRGIVLVLQPKPEE